MKNDKGKIIIWGFFGLTFLHGQTNFVYNLLGLTKMRLSIEKPLMAEVSQPIHARAVKLYSILSNQQLSCYSFVSN